MIRSASALALLVAAATAAMAEDPSIGTLIDGGDGPASAAATLLVTSKAALDDALDRFHGGRARVPEVDFAREVVLVISPGAFDEPIPPSCAGTLETDAALEVLITVPTSQSAVLLPGTAPAHPSHHIHLFLRLPRQVGKPYAVCFDERSLIAEPPRWVERTRFTVGNDGKVAELPARPKR